MVKIPLEELSNYKIISIKNKSKLDIKHILRNIECTYINATNTKSIDRIVKLDKLQDKCVKCYVIVGTKMSDSNIDHLRSEDSNFIFAVDFIAPRLSYFSDLIISFRGTSENFLVKIHKNRNGILREFEYSIYDIKW